MQPHGINREDDYKSSFLFNFFIIIIIIIIIIIYLFIYLFLFYFLFFYTSQRLFMVILCRPHWLV